MSNKYYLNKDLHKADHSYLPRDMKRGEAVYKYHGCTYGCISPSGVPCCLEDPDVLDPHIGSNPFFEVPASALSDFPPDNDLQQNTTGQNFLF